MAIKWEAIVLTGQGLEKIGEDLMKLCMDQGKFSNTQHVMVSSGEMLLLIMHDYTFYHVTMCDELN